MSRNSRNAGARQNEYFVPRDGIDREVISADICRYLGNDALVRPGQYEDPETRQIVQGYYITAYRNLTTAMIDDLKADSARWDNERRAQTSRNSTPGGQYRASETHQFRQQSGPTADGPYQSDPYARDASSFDGPRYPGTGSHGYSGASVPYQSQPQPYSSSNPYGYQQQSPQTAQDPRYAGYSQGPPMDQRYATSQAPSPYVAQGTNQQNRNRYPDDSYGSSMMPSSVAANQGPIYASSGPSASGYPATSSPYQQQYPNPVPTAAATGYQNLYPTEGGYGRASPSGQTPQQQQQQQGFPPQAQQYENPTSRASVPPTTATSTAGANKRRSERDEDRHQRHPRR